MKEALKSLVRSVPFIKKLYEQVEQEGLYPAGHYYSPIPAKEDVLAYVKASKPLSRELLGLDLNEEAQRATLKDYIGFYHELPFPEKQSTRYRYYYDNTWFSYSDAIFLYSFLRKYKPRRIVEVGSGYSSAVILDTIDVFFAERPALTFVEPYPERLLGLLRDQDQQQVKLLEQTVQSVPLDVFLSLESGDLLFIDSSHVVKCGSDLHFLFFEVLPRLKPGVVVHFHDVFYPFDYPAEWLLEGRYWNENYFLRAFLSYNSEWSIQFFNTYVHFICGDVIRENMPLCAKNPGGSLYIQRKALA
ncbi:MAG: class I SAM-dependent methyltransferase [Cyanobacteriota bacterium]|nr:class I SAM-dependent methyltransferase [Cyanobacteriota bacterium]